MKKITALLTDEESKLHFSVHDAKPNASEMIIVFCEELNFIVATARPIPNAVY